MREIKDITDEYLDSNFEDEVFVSDFYEKNKDVILTASEFDSKECFEEYILMTSNMGLVSFNKGHFEKARQLCDKNLDLIQTYKTQYKLSDKFPYISSNLFIKSRVLHSTKKFNKAIKILETALLIDPEDDLYRLWIENYKLSKTYRLSNFLFLLGGLTFAYLIAFGQRLDGTLTSWVISFLAFVAIGLGYLLPYLIKLKIKKFEKNNTGGN